MIYWILFAVFLEAYSGAVAIYRWKEQGRRALLCLIPFFVFFEIDRILDGFKILIIPVRKWGQTVILLFFASLFAYLYIQWGITNLSAQNAQPLTQIMFVPICACLFVFYMGTVNSTKEILFRERIKGKWLYSLSWLLITVPFILVFIGKNKLKKEENYENK